MIEHIITKQIRGELCKNFDVSIKDGVTIGEDVVEFFDSKEGLKIFMELFINLAQKRK